VSDTHIPKLVRELRAEAGKLSTGYVKAMLDGAADEIMRLRERENAALREEAQWLLIVLDSPHPHPEQIIEAKAKLRAALAGNPSPTNSGGEDVTHECPHDWEDTPDGARICVICNTEQPRGELSEPPARGGGWRPIEDLGWREHDRVLVANDTETEVVNRKGGAMISGAFTHWQPIALPTKPYSAGVKLPTYKGCIGIELNKT
jgi:hypothetical protein